jgi:hypothetical protein
MMKAIDRLRARNDGQPATTYQRVSVWPTGDYALEVPR